MTSSNSQKRVPSDSPQRPPHQDFQRVTQSKMVDTLGGRMSRRPSTPDRMQPYPAPMVPVAWPPPPIQQEVERAMHLSNGEVS